MRHDERLDFLRHIKCQSRMSAETSPKAEKARTIQILGINFFFPDEVCRIMSRLWVAIRSAFFCADEK